MSYSGRSKPGSDKIRYYQSSAYGGEQAAPQGYIVTGAYSQGTYATPSTGYYSSTASVPRAARKYEVGEFIFRTVGNLEPHFYIVKLGYAGVYLFFLFLLQNIDCGYSLEPPRRGGSNVYPHSMF